MTLLSMALWPLLGSGLLGSCSPLSGTKGDSEKPSPLSDADVSVVENPVFGLPKNPTNAEGGVVAMQIPRLSQEENLSRISANKILPIIFGTSVSGIDFQKTLAESLGILSTPQDIVEYTYTYGENIRVRWDAETLKPLFINVLRGYKGPLNAPPEFGEVHLGDDLTELFTATDPTGERALVVWDRHFQGLDDSHNCLDIKECKVVRDGTTFYWLTRQGEVIFETVNDKVYLDRLYMTEAKPLLDAANEPIILGVGTPSYNFTSDPTVAIAAFGDPETLAAQNTISYNDGNVIIRFQSNRLLPQAMYFRKRYGGHVVAPSELGQPKIGDHFADWFNKDRSNGVELLKVLGRFFDEQPEGSGYDCRRVNSCTIKTHLVDIELSFNKGSIFFSNDERKRLNSITVIKAPPLPSVPLTFEVSIAAGTIGGLTLFDNKTKFDNKLGGSNAVENGAYLYDNKNIAILYSDEETEGPLVIELRQYFAGPIVFPAPLGTVHLGDSIAAIYQEDITASGFLVKLARALFNESETYDCFAAKKCSNFIDQKNRVLVVDDVVALVVNTETHVLETLQLYRNEL